MGHRFDDLKEGRLIRERRSLANPATRSPVRREEIRDSFWPSGSRLSDPRILGSFRLWSEFGPRTNIAPIERRLVKKSGAPKKISPCLSGERLCSGAGLNE